MKKFNDDEKSSNIKWLHNDDNIIDMVVANPFKILSAYFITNETQMPPNACSPITI